MPTPEEALDRYFRSVRLPELAAERVTLDAAYGRVAAFDQRAPHDHPARACSAVDGFAVRASELETIRVLRTTGEVRHGKAAARAIRRREAIRVREGSLLPPGADAVVPIERVSRLNHDKLLLLGGIERGQFVIAPGNDVGRDETVVEAGTVLRSTHIGVLAALGIGELDVRRRPTVGLISTGEAAVPPGKSCRVWESYDSNRFSLVGLLRSLGATLLPLPRIGEKDEAIAAGLKAALNHCDAAIISAAPACRRRDLTRAIAMAGEPGIVVDGIRMEPHSPVLLGAIGTMPLIVVPANGSAAILAMLVFGQPILERLAGRKSHATPAAATLDQPLLGCPGFDTFVPVRRNASSWIPLSLSPPGISPLLHADGYARVPGERGRLERGESAQVWAIP